MSSEENAPNNTGDYYVKVWERVPDSDRVWVPRIDLRLPAQSTIEALKQALEDEKAKEARLDESPQNI